MNNILACMFKLLSILFIVENYQIPFTHIFFPEYLAPSKSLFYTHWRLLSYYVDVDSTFLISSPPWKRVLGAQIVLYIIWPVERVVNAVAISVKAVDQVRLDEVSLHRWQDFGWYVDEPTSKRVINLMWNQLIVSWYIIAFISIVM